MTGPVFDWTIHFGDVIMAGAGAILTTIGWRLRKVYSAITTTYQQVHHHERRIELVAETVDLHSDALSKAGGVVYQPTSRRRRRTDALTDFEGGIIQP